MGGNSKFMMEIFVRDGLPFVFATIIFRGNSLTLENVLLDTGSAGTIFKVDLLIDIGVQPEPYDMTKTVYGVGGKEFVYTKTMDKVMIGSMVSDNFQVEVGKMDYGIDIDGIIGFNFMQSVGMTIDTKKLRLGLGQ